MLHKQAFEDIIKGNFFVTETWTQCLQTIGQHLSKKKCKCKFTRTNILQKQAFEDVIKRFFCD